MYSGGVHVLVTSVFDELLSLYNLIHLLWIQMNVFVSFVLVTLCGMRVALEQHVQVNSGGS